MQIKYGVSRAYTAPQVQFEISDFGFEMQDSSNFKFPTRLVYPKSRYNDASLIGGGNPHVPKTNSSVAYCRYCGSRLRGRDVPGSDKNHDTQRAVRTRHRRRLLSG